MKELPRVSVMRSGDDSHPHAAGRSAEREHQRRRAARRQRATARYGPLGAKPIGEAPIIPVAPAMGNAIADATGVRFHSLPFSADRIYSRLNDLPGDTAKS